MKESSKIGLHAIEFLLYEIVNQKKSYIVTESRLVFPWNCVGWWGEDNHGLQIGLKDLTEVMGVS